MRRMSVGSDSAPVSTPAGAERLARPEVAPAAAAASLVLLACTLS